jgi:DNA polymerase I
MSWNIELPDAQWFDMRTPEDQEKLWPIVNEVLDQEVVAIDTETTGLKVWRDKTLFWSLAWGEHRRICMPASTLPFFDESFRDAGKRWVFANAKFDMHMLANGGIVTSGSGNDTYVKGIGTIAGECVDTAVMHALLYEEESHALKDMAKQVLGWRWTDFFDTFTPLMLDNEDAGLDVNKKGRLVSTKRKETIKEMLQRCYRENLPRLVDYASNDAYGTLRLYEKLKVELERTAIYSLYPEWLPTMAHLFFLTEVPFTKVLWQCERNGVYVSRDYLQRLRGPMQEEVDDLKRKMQQLWSARVSEAARVEGRPIQPGEHSFNSDSVDQLRRYFIDWECLRPMMMTKGGKSGIKKASIDKGFLEHYENESEMAGLVLRCRKLTKLIGTYIDGADEHMGIDPDTEELLLDTTGACGRIHAKLNQDVARTGRLSSSDPNLQNIPTPEKDKFKLRGAFQAAPGADTVLIVGDYEQLEMRLLACATVTDVNPEGAKEMIQIFLDGKDIHMGNAEMVFGPIIKRQYGWDLTYDFLKHAKKVDGKVKSGELPVSARDERIALALEKRNQIKSIGFGLNYGMKENKLARQLGISKEEALALIDAYLGTYPAVQQFYDTAIAETQVTGFSFTLLGRRRFHPSIRSSNSMDRWSEERKAVNNNIQGSAADAVRLAMLNISKAKLDEKYGCRMLLQIHDELMFECPRSTAEVAMAEIKELMEHPFPTDLKVPLNVSIGIGPAWDKAK